MKKQERAKCVLDNLNKFYPNIPIPLKHKNVYELLIAVLLSAQCTDERVNKITPLLFKTANNPMIWQRCLLIKFIKSLNHVDLHLKNQSYF